MSERKKHLNRAEKQEIPDSTTKFFEGEEVFVKNNDQFILGKIKEIDLAIEKCLVNIDSGENLWVLFKDLKPWTIDVHESSVKCNVCKGTQSKKSNIVVSCEMCFRGYHQKCHQPQIDPGVIRNWICRKCKKQTCQTLESVATRKTATTTSKDLSLPHYKNNTTYNGKKKYSSSYSIQPSSNLFKGHTVCMRKSSAQYPAYKQRKSTSKVKKKNRHVENKATSHSISETQTPELPLTPPSSISALETPQLNGESPISPLDDVMCMDFSDNSPPISLVSSSLDLLSDSRESPSNITLQLQLNDVIVKPVMKSTKRKLSEKDFKITKNGIAVKKRCRFRKLNNDVNTRRVKRVSPSTIEPNNGITRISQTPVRTLSHGSTSDLRSLVHSYYDEENKELRRNGKLQMFGSCEEYRICGKRTTMDGCVQYLVEWVKCTDRF